MMGNALDPCLAIAGKDIRDVTRDRFLLIVTGFLVLSALTALITGAIALANDVATYDAARAVLLALGKAASSIKPPEFYPLRLLRGAVEQIEIVGAAIAILIGHRAAASERGRQTLALILTRPVARWQFVVGKIVAGLLLLAVCLGAVLALSALALHLLSGIGLGGQDLVRIAVVWAVALGYTASFFLGSFLLSLHLRRPSTALLAAFGLWLVLVLIAPQIGDTMDPDNQVAGGVFQALSISRPDQLVIMAKYASFESIRNGIEVASLTKHFERFAFAVLGIKATYAGLPLPPILTEKALDVVWIMLSALGFAILALLLPLNSRTLTKD